MSTHCGWNWSSASDIYRPAAQEAIGNWCKHCAKVEDRLKAGKECTVGPVGCGFTPVNHFTASGVHAQQGNAAESQERELHAGLQHTPSGHSCAPEVGMCS